MFSSLKTSVWLEPCTSACKYVLYLSDILTALHPAVVCWILEWFWCGGAGVVYRSCCVEYWLIVSLSALSRCTLRFIKNTQPNLCVAGYKQISWQISNWFCWEFPSKVHRHDVLNSLNHWTNKAEPKCIMQMYHPKCIIKVDYICQDSDKNK